ncbi:uncharacterized protein PFL1_02020 [Pseudozyma flocculosa PF-1]|uniref:Related to RNA-binding protein (RRM superfamily) n=1 Tax=Pseudozyma flocculosa TaxID=84751 RepID=A0A5C3F2B9_9BASI|nr:uncharacterized protein PFL1_02020 [Pseudozyma flocculosa PF-1]EPQ30494.1 hypothetical protein PFL1_02020 [Pseudozyma flocculosa PF-1]SPO37579.1 related to RNA-binding protein (RRM superfamily) [Pseudozyma flocculosa]
MSAVSSQQRQHSRILFVKNLNYQTQGSDLYELFGRYGALRQIRIGDGPKTRGTAYVVFEEMADAKRALDHLNGFHLQERYIVVLYHMPARLAAKADLAKREAELAELKAQHNIQDE